jgi:D-serine deaminase-like pyridoxal phosphate-dependent protein
VSVEDLGARYRRYADLLRDEPLPAALIDLDRVDRNLSVLVAPVEKAGKRLRLASKSIRSVDLIRYLIERGGGRIQGVMAYSPREAEQLVLRGLDDILIAYPTVRKSGLAAACRAIGKGARVMLTVDSLEHVEALSAHAKKCGAVLPVVLDVDMSHRLLGGALHVGVRRSPLRSVDQAVTLAKRVKNTEGVSLAGFMGYEAQIAGIGDESPFSPMTSGVKRALKDLSRGHVRRMRLELKQALEKEGIEYGLFNGGGTGSVPWSSEEDVLTEISAGSGFLASHLFDHYRGVPLEPAQCFALEVVRSSDPRMVTCFGGGFVASGESGPDRLPLPYLPDGLELLGLEGVGEVQTPLRVPEGVQLAVGDPVFFRHAKTGELAEHFNDYILVRGDRIEGRARTYRGEGWAF